MSVLDSTGEESFELVVDAEQARDAFHHPFAYATIGGVPFAALAGATDPERITLQPTEQASKSSPSAWS